MAASSAVLEDESRLSQLDRGLHKIEIKLALISGLAVFAIMLFAVVSVTGRNAINMPIPGYVDWIEQLMPLIAFMGIAYTQRDGTHIRMDILISRLHGRPLWAAELITAVLALILFILLTWGSWEHFLRSFDFARPLWSNDSSIDIALPLWPAKLLAPVAFFTLCLRLIIQILGFGRALILNLDSPVAIPMIRSAAEQAAEEAHVLTESET